MFVVTGNYMDRKNQTEKYRMRGYDQMLKESMPQQAIDANGIEIIDVSDTDMPENSMVLCYAAAIAKVASAVPPETPVPDGARKMHFNGISFYDMDDLDRGTLKAAKSIHLRPDGMFYVPV